MNQDGLGLICVIVAGFINLACLYALFKKIYLTFVIVSFLFAPAFPIMLAVTGIHFIQFRDPCLIGCDK